MLDTCPRKMKMSKIRISKIFYHIARLVIFGIIAGINSVHYPEEKTAFTVQPDPVCKSDWSFVPCGVKKSLCYMNCHCGISSR